MMNHDWIASSNIKIQASPEAVWEVLTNPQKIKAYLFGTEVSTNWELGNPIAFQGEYNGQIYKDKGKVTKHHKYNLLEYRYWSNFSGLEDQPENYCLVSYRIEPLNEQEVQFTWYQQGFATKEGQKHTEQGLPNMLQKIKTLAEESSQ